MNKALSRLSLTFYILTALNLIGAVVGSILFLLSTPGGDIAGAAVAFVGGLLSAFIVYTVATLLRGVRDILNGQAEMKRALGALLNKNKPVK